MTRAWHPVALAGLLAAAPVAAVEYMGVEAAQKLAFPDATSFAPVALALDAEARAKLAAVARPPGVRDPKVWRALAGNRLLGSFFVDAVIGKQDYILYALALDPQGRVLRLEVLEYRETHGWEIRNERWRAQFAGKATVRTFYQIWKQPLMTVGRNQIISDAIPGVNKAVKWNSPFYGVEEGVWFMSFHCFAKYVKIAFFRGASLRPLPPGESKQKDVRYLDIREDDPFDEAQLSDWIAQASRLPGERL